MANDGTTKTKRVRVHGRKQGHLPVKRDINLAGQDEKAIDLRAAIPAIVLILIAAFLFGKFAVADRLLAVSRAEGEVRALQTQINEGYRRIDSFGEISDVYAHYTYSGMTDEEVHRADRADVLRLLRRAVLPRVEVDAWNLTDNVLTVNMTAETLQVINRTVQEMEADKAVSFCTVNTAATNDTAGNAQTGRDGTVTARVVAYLNPAEGVDRR